MADKAAKDIVAHDSRDANSADQRISREPDLALESATTSHRAPTALKIDTHAMTPQVEQVTTVPGDKKISPTIKFESSHDESMNLCAASLASDAPGIQKDAINDMQVHEHVFDQLREAVGNNDSEEISKEANADHVQSQVPEIDPFDGEQHGFKNHDVPKLDTAKDFMFCKFDQKYNNPVRNIATYALQLSRSQPLSGEQRQIVFDILKTLSSIKDLTVTEAKSGDEKIWSLLMGVAGMGLSLSRPFAFPDPLPELALYLMEKIELNSGYPQAVGDDPTPSPTDDSHRSKRQKTRKETSDAKPSKKSGAIAMNDPIVGQYMRNVERTGSSYRIKDPNLMNRAQKRGHNGLTVGAWWPYRICALNAGAHGSMQGGIAGNGKDGAYSIVVSGMYGGMNIDAGDNIMYSGSDSHSNKDPVTPHESQATKWMIRSATENHEIRVLRTDKSEWPRRPSCGLRYDGLYRIVRIDTEKNEVGGAYLRFVMQRLKNQPPIDITRPTQKEKDAYEKLKNSR